MQVSYVRFLSLGLLVAVYSCAAFATSQDDISTCEKIKNAKRRGECFEKVALKLNDSKSEMETFVARAKQEATRSFLDPESGKFRNLYVTQNKSGLSLCGEINGKNSYGGYVGYRRFIQHFDTSKKTYEKVSTEPASPKDEMDKIRSDFFTMSWDLLCTNIPTIWRE